MAYIYELLKELKEGKKISSKKADEGAYLYCDLNGIIKHSLTKERILLDSRILEDDTFEVIESNYVWNLKDILELREINKIDLASIMDIIFNEIKDEINLGLNVRDEKYIDVYIVKDIIIKRFIGVDKDE